MKKNLPEKIIQEDLPKVNKSEPNLPIVNKDLPDIVQEVPTLISRETSPYRSTFKPISKEAQLKKAGKGLK